MTSRWRRKARRFGITLLFVMVGSGLWYAQERVGQSALTSVR